MHLLKCWAGSTKLMLRTQWIFPNWFIRYQKRSLSLLQNQLKTQCSPHVQRGKIIRFHQQIFRNSAKKYCKMVQKWSLPKIRCRKENWRCRHGKKSCLMDLNIIFRGGSYYRKVDKKQSNGIFNKRWIQVLQRMAEELCTKTQHFKKIWDCLI